MVFTVLEGAVGSGKSANIERKIEESVSFGRNALVIVPERFSHIEEKTLCEKFGGLGVNGIGVTTFSKLSARLSRGKEHLNPTGREMLVLKATKKCQGAGDGIFDGAYERNGFIAEVSSAISEFKKSQITPEMLKNYQDGGLLGKKIWALGEILEEYNSSVSKKYSEPDENMCELAQNIEDSDSYDNTDIYIDGFSDFMANHYSVIEALVKKAHSVTVSLTLNDNAEKGGGGIFLPVVTALSKFKAISKSLGVELKYEHQEGEYNYIKAEDIRYFLKNYDQYTDLSNPPLCENIKLSVLKNRHSEAEYLASRIMEEVRDRKIRFRDIGVIIGNSDAYLHIIESVFTSYKIPYSSDGKMCANEHPVIRMILSVFKVITENWSYASLFEYLRSGYIYHKTDIGIKPYDKRKIDELDIYVKSHGIRGKNLWLSDEKWKKAKKGIFDEATGAREEKADIDTIDQIRRELMMPFSKLLEKIKGRQKAEMLAAALFEFLEDICLYEGISQEIKKLENANMLDEASRLATVWNIICQTLDQLVMVSGGEYVSREDFCRLLEAGFSKASVDIVPSGADRVMVSAVDTNRPVRVKTLFVLGASNGELPMEVGEFGIISASDRALLSASGFDSLADKASKTALSEFNLFSSLTAGYERLYFSYPEYSDEGEKNTPASVIGELLRFFGDSVYSKKDSDWKDIFSSKDRAYNKMISRLSDDISDDERKLWESVWDSLKPWNIEDNNIEYSMQSEDFSIFDGIESQRLDLIRMLADEGDRGYIRPETAKLLYGEHSLSISALQKYNKCPFSYFATYGLKLKSDDERGVGASDIGLVVHWAVCEFCKIVQDGADTSAEKKAKWLSLDKEKREKIIYELTDKIGEITKSSNPDFTPERIEMIMKKSAEVIKRSVEVIRLSLTEGEFSACDFEKPFRFTLRNNKGSIELGGIIDRLDVAEKDGDRLLRVIDYKTGRQEFSVAGIYNKTDLQLMVYALAAEDMYKAENAKIGAVMYDKITEETEKIKIGEPISFRLAPLDGVIVFDDEKDPAEEILLHTKELAENDTLSSFLPLATKKRGGLRSNKVVIPRTKFDILKRYITKTVIDTKTEIYSGNVKAYPLGEGLSGACQWCDYSSVCLYNKKRDGMRSPITAKDKAWEQLEAEDKKDE